MKRSRMLLGALLIGTASFAVICSCPPVHEALWFADGGGIGAKVLVDGKLLGVLESSGDRSYALRAPYYLAPCYSEGDTVVAVGEDRVGMFLNMPDGEHPVTVVTKGGDSVSVTAYLWDSPRFFLWVECGILSYPSREGKKTAQFQRRGERPGR